MPAFQLWEDIGHPAAHLARVADDSIDPKLS